MTSLLSGTTGWRPYERGDDDVDLARDRLVVSRAQAGDRRAFDDLYLRYYRRLYRFCLRRVHDAHEAEDVAQEAFARAWRALPSFGGERRFYPWLSVIASHLCTDVIRRRTRSTPVAEFHPGDVASAEDGGEELVVAAADGVLAAQAFARLSERHRRVLDLRERSGWSYQRIADHEGVGITAVETLLWRARQALKREFAALGGIEGSGAAIAGGVFTLARLRRLLGAPASTARRLAHAGPGAVVAIGSAAATTAIVVTASVHGSPPAPSTTVSWPRLPVATAGPALAGVNPADATDGAARAVDPWGRAVLDGPATGTPSASTGGPGFQATTQRANPGTSSAGNAGSGPPGNSGSGLLGGTGTGPPGSSGLGQLGNTASGLVGSLGTTVQHAVAGVGQAVNNTAAPLLGPVSQATNETPLAGVAGTASSALSAVGSTANQAASSIAGATGAAGTGTQQATNGVGQVASGLLNGATQLLGGK
jgi:RNA polymerase sigma-70 factor, ECF subfamily